MKFTYKKLTDVQTAFIVLTNRSMQGYRPNNASKIVGK